MKQKRLLESDQNESDPLQVHSKHLKKLATNSFFSAISELSIALLFLLFIVAARQLGDVEFGVFSFALAYVSLFGIISDCGLRYHYVKDVSRDRSLASKYFGNMLSLQIGLSLLGLSLIFLSINMLDKSPETRTVVHLLAGAEIMRSLKFFFRFVFRAAERFELESLTVLIERIALLAVGVIVLFLGKNVVWLAGVFFVIRVLDFFISVAIIKKLVEVNLAFDFSFWPALLKAGLPYALTGVVMLIMLRVDTIMISLMRNDAEVGWYNAGYKLIEGAAFIPSILSNSLFPSVSKLHNKKDAVLGLYERAMKYVLLIAIPLAIIGFVIADQVILFVFGQTYVQAIIVLKILIWSVLFAFSLHIGGAVLAGLGKQKISLMIASFALLINVVLNLILIPQKGYMGAAITTVISEMIFCFLIGWSLFSLGYKTNYLKLSLKPLLAAVIVALVLVAFPLSLGWALLFAIVAYWGIITLLAYWDAEEILLMKKMFNSIRNALFP